MALPTARDLAREELTRRILAAARQRLTRGGPGQLSLRAVARDVDMVSSAVYRYFPSRDDLLTALILQCYDELGEAVERADAAVEDRTDVLTRWMASCRAVRSWSIEHPGEFALLYGSPVPGYAAPQDTIGAAVRVVVVLVRIVSEARAAGAAAPVPPPGAGTVAPSVAGAARFMLERSVIDEAPAELVLRTLMGWTTLFGTVSFELFGHLTGAVDDPAAYFDHVVRRLAADIGLLPDRARS